MWEWQKPTHPASVDGIWDHLYPGILIDKVAENGGRCDNDNLGFKLYPWRMKPRRLAGPQRVCHFTFLWGG